MKLPVRMCSGYSLYVVWQNALVIGMQHKSQPSLWINANLLSGSPLEVNGPLASLLHEQSA